VKLVWLSMHQMFGDRWEEKMGADPLGESDEKLRNDMWCDALEKVQMPYIRQAINRVRTYDAGADRGGQWWLPSLPQFLAFAGRANLDPVKPSGPPVPPPTWVDKAGISFMVAWMIDHPLICEEDTHKLVEAMRLTCRNFNTMIPEEIPATWTVDAHHDLVTELKMRFLKIKARPASAEERARRLSRPIASAASSPIRETSSSSAPPGVWTPGELLNFD
jgi:hypothetical protein